MNPLKVTLLTGTLAMSLVASAVADQRHLPAHPLHRAAMKGDIEAMTGQLDAGVEVDRRTEKAVRHLMVHGESKVYNPVHAHSTALHLAAAFRQPAAVKFLITQGADVNALNKFGETPLKYAAGQGDLESLKALLKAKADPNKCGPSKNLPLSFAAGWGKMDAAKLLIESGAKIDDGRVNPLHQAIFAKDLKMVEWLLTKGADVECRTRYEGNPGQFTPLALTINTDHGEMTALLLKHGADPESPTDKREWTPIHLALHESKAGPAEALIAHLTPEQLEKGHVLHKVAGTRLHPLIEALAKRKIDLNAKNEDGETALHVAVKSGYTDSVSLLLKHGADPNVPDKRGQSPLFRAVFMAMRVTYGYTGTYGMDPIIQEPIYQDLAVLENGVLKSAPIDPEKIKKAKAKKMPPAQTNPMAIKTLRVLLDGGAKPDHKDPQGFSPRDLAKAAGEFERIAKIMHVTAAEVKGGGSMRMEGGLTYWITVQGGHKSTLPLQMIVDHTVPTDWLGH